MDGHVFEHIFVRLIQTWIACSLSLVCNLSVFSQLRCLGDV